MLSRWHIEEAFTDKDPKRRLLRVKGALKDVHSLIRRFGAVCGRPKKERGDSPFNYRLYLHSIAEERVKELEAELNSMGGKQFLLTASSSPSVPPAPVTPETPASSDLPALPSADPKEDKEAMSLSVPEAPAPAVQPPAVQAPPEGGAPTALWGSLSEFHAGWSLDSYVVGGFNRFAHAAAMSVLSSPGSMHNPLYVSGPPLCGKSHMLHGIGRKLGEQARDEPVWMTTGARLSRAVDTAIAQNKMPELLEFAGKSRALIIDDAHLMGLTETNRQGLSDIVTAYRGAGKQIILSSIYPQKFLGGLDEGLQFQFAAGHGVEFKSPGGDAKKEIAAAILDRIKCPQEGREGFISQVAADPDGFLVSAQRLVSLRRLKQRGGIQIVMADAQAALYGVSAEASDVAAEELRAGLAGAAAPEAGSRSVMLFYPSGQDAHADWSWRQLFEASKVLGAEFGFSAPIRKTYDLDPPSAAPFAVAAECIAARPHAAVVVGPSPGCALAEHEGDFKYALGHLIRDVSIRMGWINFRQMKNPQAFINAYLDVWDGAAVYP